MSETIERKDIPLYSFSANLASGAFNLRLKSMKIINKIKVLKPKRKPNKVFFNRLTSGLR
jgi:hypothetical protein